MDGRERGPGPVVRSSREYTGAGWRTYRRSGIKPVEAQAAGRHGIEIRRLEDRVIVIAGQPPALVVGHDQDDVGVAAIGSQGRCPE